MPINRTDSSTRIYTGITIAILSILALATAITLVENIRFFRSELTIAFPEPKTPTLPSIERTKLSEITQAINIQQAAPGVAPVQVNAPQNEPALSTSSQQEPQPSPNEATTTRASSTINKTAPHR